jgi:Tfp pilus assembly protein PilP
LRHRLLVLNILLAGVTAAVGWRLRQDWLHDHQHASTVINRRVNPAPAPAIAPVPVPAPFAAPTYADVAQKDLFSKDRNPNVVIEPVAVKPAPKWPRMPILFGVMGLPDGLVAMLAEKPDARSRGVRTGDKIGDLKVVKLNADKISFEFEGEVKEVNVQDLIDRGGHAEVAAASAGDASVSQNPANVAAQKPPPPAKPGVEVGLGSQGKACQPGDTSPGGTVVDGYKKVIKINPFGSECSWVAQ